MDYAEIVADLEALKARAQKLREEIGSTERMQARVRDLEWRQGRALEELRRALTMHEQGKHAEARSPTTRALCLLRFQDLLTEGINPKLAARVERKLALVRDGDGPEAA